MSIEISTKSRIMDSTSRPTYPTSVNLLASTFMNGELASLARRRASSVLPTPVAPIMRIFFGMTSSAISGSSFWRRMRLRSAMDTARLASGCQMTQDLVGAPILGQFHYGPWKISVELLQLGFEAREKRKGVRCGSGEAGENLVVI